MKIKTYKIMYSRQAINPAAKNEIVGDYAFEEAANAKEALASFIKSWESGSKLRNCKVKIKIISISTSAENDYYPLKKEYIF